MAYRLPSLANVVRSVRASLTAAIPGADAEIWPNNLGIVGKVVGVALYEVHLRLEWIYRQMFASTATGEHLDRHAYEVGLARKPAAYSEGLATVTGTPGEVVPAGRRFVRALDNRAFVSIQAYVIPPSGEITLAVRSAEAGRLNNVSPNATLLRESDYEELTSDATVSSDGLTGAADAETDAQLRDRILYRRRNPPMGGSLSDYRIWAESVVGVRRAVVGTDDTSGRMVVVYVLADGLGSNAIPTDALVAQVAATIEAERPVTARVTVAKPVAQAINITIEGLAPSSREIKAEIQRELQDMFYEKATVALPGTLFTFPRSWIEAAIDAAAGEERHTLTTPAADVECTAGKVPVLGTITYN